MKICPIMAAGYVESREDPGAWRYGVRCREDRCAWFHVEYDPESDSATGECALLRIAEVLHQKRDRPGRWQHPGRKEGPTQLQLRGADPD